MLHSLFIFLEGFMKILKHGIYFSLVENRIVHCPKCHCIFGIEKIDDIYYTDRFSHEDMDYIKGIYTTCPECHEHMCLESEVDING